MPIFAIIPAPFFVALFAVLCLVCLSSAPSLSPSESSLSAPLPSPLVPTLCAWAGACAVPLAAPHRQARRQDYDVRAGLSPSPHLTKAPYWYRRCPELRVRAG